MALTTVPVGCKDPMCQTHFMAAIEKSEIGNADRIFLDKHWFRGLGITHCNVRGWHHVTWRGNMPILGAKVKVRIQIQQQKSHAAHA